ncbi:ABC transporter ATP-binding protein [Salana multivorans]
MTDTQGLEAVALTKTYGEGPTATHALAGVDLRIAPGESVAIMGPSGSGKTTLLHVLAGILPATAGTVMWRGRSIADMSDADRTTLRRSEFGFVFQSGQPARAACRGERGPAAHARRNRRRRGDGPGPAVAQPPRSARDGDAPPRASFSGGQAQRVAIARALVGNPGVIFADEPTGALDQATGWEVMNSLTTACRAQGASLVLVTHDVDVAHWCSRTVQMRDGLIVGEARQAAPAQEVAR